MYNVYVVSFDNFCSFRNPCSVTPSGSMLCATGKVLP